MGFWGFGVLGMRSASEDKLADALLLLVPQVALGWPCGVLRAAAAP